MCGCVLFGCRNNIDGVLLAHILVFVFCCRDYLDGVFFVYFDCRGDIDGV